MDKQESRTLSLRLGLIFLVVSLAFAALSYWVYTDIDRQWQAGESIRIPFLAAVILEFCGPVGILIFLEAFAGFLGFIAVGNLRDWASQREDAKESRRGA